jgi:hypothetical protein
MVKAGVLAVDSARLASGESVATVAAAVDVNACRSSVITGCRPYRAPRAPDASHLGPYATAEGQADQPAGGHEPAQDPAK